MALVRRDLFKETEDFFDRFNRLWGHSAFPRIASQNVMANSEWIPAVDISETEKEFIIKAELPEVKKEDVKVTVHEGVLTITGERKQEKEEKDKKMHRVERFYGTFSRQFALPDNVDDANIAAEYKDGMLILHLTKTVQEKPQAKEIEVK